jgi:DNA polymerase
MEEDAIAAVRGDDSGWFVYKPPFLFCQLPSGRRLAYPFPEIKARATPWGDIKASLTFMGTNTYSRQWTRQVTYGGSLVENITQAVARDVLAEAMLRCEWTGLYLPVLSVHDELICEADEGRGNVAEFVALLEEPPEWAPDCPIAADGFSTFPHKYRK